MPSKNMLPKGKRRQSVRAEYRKIRTQINDARDREKELEEAVAAAPFLFGTVQRKVRILEKLAVPTAVSRA